jgi:hypothetical protein
MSERGLSLLSQLLTGEFTEALPDHPHDGLQQSQYLVVFPVLVWASTRAVPKANVATASCERKSILKVRRVRDSWRRRWCCYRRIHRTGLDIYAARYGLTASFLNSESTAKFDELLYQLDGLSSPPLLACRSYRRLLQTFCGKSPFEYPVVPWRQSLVNLHNI